MANPDTVYISSPASSTVVGTSFTVIGKATSPTNTVNIAVFSNGTNVASAGAVAVDSNNDWQHTFSSIAPCSDVKISAYYTRIENANSVFNITVQ